MNVNSTSGNHCCALFDFELFVLNGVDTILYHVTLVKLGQSSINVTISYKKLAELIFSNNFCCPCVHEQPCYFRILKEVVRNGGFDVQLLNLFPVLKEPLEG